jgi:hypothetical protein
MSCYGPGSAARRTKRFVPGFELIRALTRFYYAGVLLSASAAVSRAPPDTDLSAPTVREFQQAIHEKRLKPDAPETKHILGKMFLASFLAGVPPLGFDAAVQRS